jgi:hypothetical protein
VQVVTDTLRAASAIADTLRPPTSVASPLPGGAAEVVRFLFNLPRWFQIAGFVAGVLVALALVVYLWRHRQAIRGWLASRQRGFQFALAGTVAALIVIAGGAGAAGWHYMQHDNGFCTGCHVMNVPFGKFQARAGKHDTLQCHACHQQSIVASMRQLYLWVAERPDEIKPHAKVPNAVCSGCHVTGHGEKKWQDIAATAGHRVHLESDSSALKDMQCVTCHGYEVHLFVPVDRTCMQSGCHDKLKIELGKMAGQTSLHCATCHQFTAAVPKLATYDSAAKTLVPTNRECLSCHEMQRVLGEFDPARDPHQGTCGTCHVPHTQSKAAEAAKTCTQAGCHDNWRNAPFHVGVAHRKVSGDCLVCHNPHQAKVDPSDCQACHARVRAAGRLKPPVPFDTSRALRGRPPPTDTLGGAGGGGTSITGFTGWGAEWERPFSISDWLPHAGTGTAVDSFPHARHRSLACLTCHTSTQSHGRLTFEPPRGCQICHHVVQREKACTTCHQASKQAETHVETIAIAVPNRTPRSRSVMFRHLGPHQELPCRECHSTDVSLAPPPAVTGCTACHERHHANPTTCSTCHTGVDLKGAHAQVMASRAPVAVRGAAEVHQECDACHSPSIVADLVPTRSLCLVCHTADAGHNASRECTVCHFLADPNAYRSHLRRARSGQ